MRLPEPEGMALVDVGILGVVGVVGVGGAGRNPDSDRCGGDGSDPGFLRVLASSHLRAGQSVQRVAHKFRCWDELRYALRSIVRYATDWTGVIYIVTQHGQVPAWMDQSHPGVRIVSLEQLLTEAKAPPDVAHVQFERDRVVRASHSATLAAVHLHEQ